MNRITPKVVAWVLGVIVGGTLFCLTLIQFPTANPFRILGQLLGAAGVGGVLAVVAFVLSSLVARLARRP
jgi:hypothetical protein